MCKFCLKYNNGDCLSYCVADKKQRKAIVERQRANRLKSMRPIELKNEK